MAEGEVESDDRAGARPDDQTRGEIQRCDQPGGVVGMPGNADRRVATSTAAVAAAVEANAPEAVGEPSSLVCEDLGVATHAVHEQHRRPVSTALVIDRRVVDLDRRHVRLLRSRSSTRLCALVA